jgi:hypothetical protein
MNDKVIATMASFPVVERLLGKNRSTVEGVNRRNNTEQLARRITMLVKGALMRKHVPSDLTQSVLEFADLYVTFRIQGTVEISTDDGSVNKTLVSTTIPANLRDRLHGVRVECESQQQGPGQMWLVILTSPVAGSHAQKTTTTTTTKIANLGRGRSFNTLKHIWERHDITMSRAELLKSAESMIESANDMDLQIDVGTRSVDEQNQGTISTRPVTLTLIFNNSGVL